MLDFFKKILSDEHNIPSTKRVIALIGTFALIAYMFCFQSTIALEAITIIILGSLGVTGAISIFGNKNKL